MERPLHLVGCTGDGCRIGRDGLGGYLVLHEQMNGRWQRVANLPAAYSICALLNQRSRGAPPKTRGA